MSPELNREVAAPKAEDACATAAVTDAAPANELTDVELDGVSAGKGSQMFLVFQFKLVAVKT